MQTLTRSGPLLDAVRDTFRLRYLEGGKMGCFNEDERPTDRRRIYHHFTFYGFLLCFASTSTASVYHYLGYEAPYAWYDLPVVLGTIGGIGLLIGPAGLLAAKFSRDPDMLDKPRLGMDVAFIAMLFLTGLTGLALLVVPQRPGDGPPACGPPWLRVRVLYHHAVWKVRAWTLQVRRFDPLCQGEPGAERSGSSRCPGAGGGNRPGRGKAIE